LTINDKETQMITRAKKILLLPLLALGMSLIMVSTASSDVSLRISFGSQPHWRAVPGTRVEEIPLAERPGYDVFHYGTSYYAYSNNHWYRSPRESGDFIMIDDATVPSEFSRIPRDHWREYPSTWQDRYSDRVSANLDINFDSRPRWSSIRGTNIREIRSGGRSDYDMFRYGRTYYAYNHNNGRWYASRNYSGRFMLIDDRSVPRELRRIPRNHWRNYPTAWEGRRDDQYGNRDNGGYYGNRDNGGYYGNRDNGGYYGNRDNNGDGGYNGNRDNYGTFQVTFGSSPRWSNISGTRVEGIYGADRPGYDIFRYRGTYYVYNNNHWYSSSRESGEFSMMDDRSVPTELSSVPRENWRHYPASWDRDNNDGSRGRNDQRGNGGGY
jgi:hypothetical protein